MSIKWNIYDFLRFLLLSELRFVSYHNVDVMFIINIPTNDVNANSTQSPHLTMAVRGGERIFMNEMDIIFLLILIHISPKLNHLSDGNCNDSFLLCFTYDICICIFPSSAYQTCILMILHIMLFVDAIQLVGLFFYDRVMWELMSSLDVWWSGVEDTGYNETVASKGIQVKAQHTHFNTQHNSFDRTTKDIPRMVHQAITFLHRQRSPTRIIPSSRLWYLNK